MCDMTKKQWANSIICLIILMVFVYGVKRIAQAPDLVSLFNPEVAISAEASALKDKVTIEAVQFNINQVTKQVKAAFELSNRSALSIKDVSISCDFHDSNGEFRGRGRWKIFETLPANHSDRYVLTDRRYISYLARPEQTACKIVDVVTSGASIQSDDRRH